VSRIVLASKSAARADLLKNAGIGFEAVGAGVDEGPIKTGLLRRGAPPAEIARTLAEEKAKAGSLRREGLVIGADQTLELEGRLVDKADNLAEARERLRLLRAREHRLHSGVAVAEAGEIAFTAVETARLVMRPFSDAWLEDYLDRNGQDVLGSVGCYLLEGEGVQLFEDIEGNYFTILGLPLLPLLQFLRQKGAIAA
jgi:septum formation protein